MARALDLGSTQCVVAELRDGQPLFRQEQTAYVTLAAGRRTEETLRNAGIRPVEWEGRVLALGEDAMKVALVQGAPDGLRHPLSDGHFQAGNAEAEGVVGLLVESMLGEPETRGETLGITLPGMVGSSETDHHRQVVSQMAERSGFRPVLVPQGLALLLAGGGADFTGLAVSFGASGWHTTLVHKGQVLSNFTCGFGGRQIDAAVARSSGFPAVKVSWRKDHKLSFLAEVRDPVLDALRSVTGDAVRAWLTQLEHEVTDCADQLDGPVDLLVAGGGASTPGFATFLRNILKKAGAPIGIKGVKVGREPRKACAAGALIAAMAAEGTRDRGEMGKRAAAWAKVQGKAVRPPRPVRRGSLGIVDPRDDDRTRDMLLEPNRLKGGATGQGGTILDKTQTVQRVPALKPRTPSASPPVETPPALEPKARTPAPFPEPPASVKRAAPPPLHEPPPVRAPEPPEPAPMSYAEDADVLEPVAFADGEAAGGGVTIDEPAEPEPMVVFAADDAGGGGLGDFDGLADLEVASFDAMADDVDLGAAPEITPATVPAPAADTTRGGSVEPLDVQGLLGGKGVPPVRPASRTNAPKPAPATVPAEAAAAGGADVPPNLTEMLKALWDRVRKLESAEAEREAGAKARADRERLERGDVHTATVPDKFKRFFSKMVTDGASDLFVSAGSRAALRVDGRVKFVTGDNASGDFVRAMFESLIGLPYDVAFAEHKELDFAFEIPNVGRFRANLFHQKGEVGGVFRHIKDKVPSFEELNLPAKQLMRLAKLKRGLVLVTGIAGSGKSTTLAGMMEYINETMHRHMITIEDPIEFVYREKLAVIDQREVGLDTPSFERALKSAVRQSPDVILVGEMRDKDTMQAAIQAAETGHLVFSTLHTVNAQQTVERIITYFPPHQHDLLRLQLSMVLAGVISQRLLPKRDTGGRVPAVEVMLTTPTIKDIIYEGRTRELYAAIADDTYFGNMTFNESLRKLYEAGVISLEEAMAAADNPDELKLEIRGISRGTKASDLDFQF